jgi:hypothetical protein
MDVLQRLHNKSPLQNPLLVDKGKVLASSKLTVFAGDINSVLRFYEI